MNRMLGIISLLIGLVLLAGVLAAIIVSFVIVGKNISGSPSAKEFKDAIWIILACNAAAVLVLFALSYYFTATSQPSERMYLLIMTSLNLYIALNALGIGAMSQSQITASVK